MVSKAEFSSNSEEWETPNELYNVWNRLFNFELDAAATKENAKCPIFFTKEDDGLSKDWGGKRVWLNPPYGRGITGKWVNKAFEESQKGSTIVMLLPVRTDQWWFQTIIWPLYNSTLNGERMAEIFFLNKRVKFVGATSGAPYCSMIVVLRGQNVKEKRN